MINQTVGNYRIVREIGTGGMGVVYLAQHPGIGRVAAVKVLHPALAQDEAIMTRFINEARAANAVRHPGIVEIFDFGSLPSGATYIIMEYLEGESLAARIRRGGMSIAEAMEIAYQTAGVLGAAHDKGIVHRDLKPDNLFLIPDTHNPGLEMVKVLDFGIAKLSNLSTGSAQTRTGTMLGTPIYMSPEQCRGIREVDHRTDIYALGIILYQMLCGQPPFLSQGLGDLIHMHIGTAPPPLRSFNPSIPPELESVVLHALAKDPDNRLQTMAHFQAALKGVPQQMTAATQRLPASPPRRTGVPVQTTFSSAASVIDDQAIFRPRTRWMPLALGVLLASGGAAAVFLLAAKGPPPLGSPTRDASSSRPVEPPAAPPTGPGPTPAPPHPPPVSIGIKSTPSGARVLRDSDGADLGVTPFQESWPFSAGREKLRLELVGHRAESFVVPLDRSVNLTFALRAIPSHPSSRRKVRAGTRGTIKPAPDHDVAPSPEAPKSPPRQEPVPL